MDVISPIFFQKHWHISSESISAIVLHGLNFSEIPRELNHTFTTLILKKKDPRKIGDFHPISLYNIVYKFILKVIANRLKRNLPSLISEFQRAFVSKSRLQITIAYELIHYLRRKMRDKKGFISIKLNMSKAYDRVE